MTPAAIERKARIFNVQKYSIYDGPGIRTLVFFKGCPLRCRWCSNPEGMEKNYQVMYQSDLCMHCGACAAACPAGIHRMEGTGGAEHRVDREKDCVNCRRCQDACPRRAISIAGKEMTVSEALGIVCQDVDFYRTSGGGVTLGGGEVLMWPEFAASLMTECKREGIHTAVETCGYAGRDALQTVAECADLFLYDLKHIDPDRHYAYTGVRNERILENLDWLIRHRKKVRIRMPLIKGVNDDDGTVRKTAEFLTPYQEFRNFLGIDLLPYHKLGVNKYRQLDLKYTLDGDLSLSEPDLKRIGQIAAQYEIPVRLIRH